MDRSTKLMALAVLAGGLVAASEAIGQETRRCAVSGLEGVPVEVWQDGVWSDVAVGPLPEGELKFRTGPAARAEITCDDRLVLTVGFGTEVNLEELIGPSGPQRNVVLQLLRGIVAIVAPERSWRELELRTPLAIAAARSTEWTGEAGAEGASAFFVREGRVAVRPLEPGAWSEAVVGTGEGITIPADAAPGPVTEWGRPRIEATGAALGFGWP